jgi:hypothetical protein
MKSYKYLWFAFFCAIALLFYQTRKLAAAKKEQIEVRQTNDSLRSEVFVLELQLNRYEITVEHFKEEDPEVYQKFDKWLSNNTE